MRYDFIYSDFLPPDPHPLLKTTPLSILPTPPTPPARLKPTATDSELVASFYMMRYKW